MEIKKILKNGGEQMRKMFMFILFIIFMVSLSFSGTITVNSPNGGESLGYGSNSVISWSGTGLTNPVKITLWKGGVFVGLIVKDQPVNGNYPWIVGTYDGGSASCSSDYKIKIREQGGASFTTADSSNKGFTITGCNSITVKRPSGSDVWRPETFQNITWTSSAGEYPLVKISFISERGGAPVVITSSTENDGTFRWKIPVVGYISLTNTGTLVPLRYFVRVEALNNSFADDSAIFRITRSVPDISDFSNGPHNPLGNIDFSNDLEVSDIFVRNRCKIWVKFTNNGKLKIDHGFIEKIWVNGRLLHNKKIHLKLNSGRSHLHEILGVSASSNVGKRIKVEIVTPYTFRDSKKANNTLVKRVTCSRQVGTREILGRR